MNEEIFYVPKSYYEKNAIEVRNITKTELSTDKIIFIFGAQNIKIRGIFYRSVL